MFATISHTEATTFFKKCDGNLGGTTGKQHSSLFRGMDVCFLVYKKESDKMNNQEIVIAFPNGKKENYFKGISLEEIAPIN